MENENTVDAAGSEPVQDEIAGSTLATEDSAPSKSDTTDDTPEKKVTGGWQKSIDRLGRQKHALQETVAQKDRELEDLRRQLQKPADAKAESKDAAPKEEDFTDYNAYLRAEARHEAKQAARELVEERERAQAQQQVETTTREQVSRRQADFKVAVELVQAVVPDFERVANSAHISPEVGQALLASDKGAAVVYFLGANPDEADRIARASKGDPVRAAIEIARLESKADALIQQRTRSGASKQSEPLSAGGRAVAGDPSDKDDINDWMKKRRKQVYG